MIGLFFLLLLSALCLGVLRLAGLRGATLTLAGAALAFGGALYALAGRPDLSGSPRAAAARAAPMPLTGARQAFMGRFNSADRWLTISESYASRGKTHEAVGVLQSAIRAHPGDYALWVGLGNALTDHAGTLTPAGRLAFERAAELAPGHPAPRFFLGLAEIRAGETAAGLASWRELLADAPANASWRPLVEQGLIALTPRAQPQAQR